MSFDVNVAFTFLFTSFLFIIVLRRKHLLQLLFQSVIEMYPNFWLYLFDSWKYNLKLQ